MKKRYITIFCMLAVTCIMLTCTALQRDRQALAEKLVRLHVVANSDSDYDQSVKLQVRDAVLERAAELMSGTAEPKDALRKGLPEIQAAAQACLTELRVEAPVTVTLGRELFPTRDYDTFSLPSGVYTALRVTIGKGEGHNWWCVVFPSLCMTASMEDLKEAAETAGFSSSEIRLITEAGEGYVIKFKVLELLQELKNFLIS